MRVTQPLEPQYLAYTRKRYLVNSSDLLPLPVFTKYLLTHTAFLGILMCFTLWPTQAGHAQFAGEKTEAQEGRITYLWPPREDRSGLEPKSICLQDPRS